MRLTEIQDGWATFDAAMEASGGELTPELIAELDCLSLAEREKIDGYCFFIKELEGRAASYRAIAGEIDAKRKAAESRVAWLKAHVKTYMEERKIKELPGSVFRFALQKSGKPPVELLVPLDVLPTIYYRVTIEPDKAKLAADLAENDPMALSVARYGEPTISLRIY